MSGHAYIVSVEHRLDGLYAFTSEEEAARFIRGVIENGGGDCEMLRLPLNRTPADTDRLILAERDPER